MTEYVVGVDVGQAHDPTALVVLERVGTSIHVIDIDRLTLGTPYPDQARQLAAGVRTPPLAGHVHMAVDATGVGRPVVDMLEPIVGCPLTPIVITAGTTPSSDGGWLRVPKRDLIATSQIALEQGVLLISPHLPDVDVLVSELRAYRVSISTNGHDTYANSARENDHDDLVLALAVGVYLAERLGWRYETDSSPGVARFAITRAMNQDATSAIAAWNGHPAAAVQTGPLEGWWR